MGILNPTSLCTVYMNTSLVSSPIVDLLSRITGQKLTQNHITAPVTFLASLVTVLLGVIFVDGTVAEEEKQKLLTILYRFSTPESDVRRLTHLMIKGIKENQIYKQINNLLILSNSLSESEKLLLIAFGYEISAIDGIGLSEKQYLEIIGKHLGINFKYSSVLESAFTYNNHIDYAALDEVRFRLDPCRFNELDIVFVKAASDMLAALPTKPEKQITQQKQVAYSGLKKFQENQKELEYLCYSLFQVVEDCNARSFLHNTLIDEVGAVSKKLQSQSFRLAVVGEFSQGKSTLLNALLGEEIQPVRAIPCSGTVTVLKYGTEKRVICRYKDGHSEEIPFEEYKLKAAISKEAALEHRSDELAQSNIAEIIFEHPDLELCKSGVEILDSPGLNEHPERTAITQKLLKDADAAIFLTNAMRLLPEKEKELIQDVRLYLNANKDNEPAENLFVVVNFMDSLDDEQDKQDIKQRLTSFVKDKNLLSLAGENRIHYISAKAALKAIINGNDDEYRKSFHAFSDSLEKFLTLERGALKMKRSVSEVSDLIKKSLDGLEQAQKILDGKVEISESEKQKIFEQIGEASGRDVRIRIIASQLIEQAIDEAVDSWDEWHEGLGERLAEKSQYWYSEHSPVWSQNKLIQDYADQFVKNLSQEIDDWGNAQLKNVILQNNLKILDVNIEHELDAIQSEFKNIEQQVKADFSQQLQLSINGINDDFMGLGGIGGGLGIGGALAAGLIVFTGLGFVAVIVASIAATIAGSFGLGMFDVDGLHNQIKSKVFEIGFEKFGESIDKVFEKVHEITTSVFDTKVESASRVISQAISLYENLLQQHEKAHQETLEQREADKTWICQKRQDLEQLNDKLEALMQHI